MAKDFTRLCFERMGGWLRIEFCRPRSSACRRNGRSICTVPKRKISRRRKRHCGSSWKLMRSATLNSRQYQLAPRACLRPCIFVSLGCSWIPIAWIPPCVPPRDTSVSLRHVPDDTPCQDNVRWLNWPETGKYWQGARDSGWRCVACLWGQQSMTRARLTGDYHKEQRGAGYLPAGDGQDAKARESRGQGEGACILAAVISLPLMPCAGSGERRRGE